MNVRRALHLKTRSRYFNVGHLPASSASGRGNWRRLRTTRQFLVITQINWMDGRNPSTTNISLLPIAVMNNQTSASPSYCNARRASARSCCRTVRANFFICFSHRGRYPPPVRWVTPARDRYGYFYGNSQIRFAGPLAVGRKLSSSR